MLPASTLRSSLLNVACPILCEGNRGVCLRKLPFFEIWRRVLYYEFACTLQERATSVLCVYMKGARFCQVMVGFYQTTRCHVSEDDILHGHRPVNFKISYVRSRFFIKWSQSHDIRAYPNTYLENVTKFKHLWYSLNKAYYIHL